MKQFIGCDVHKRYSVFVSLDETGKASRAVRAAHGNGELEQYLSSLPADTPVAVETTGHWSWLLDAMTEAADGRTLFFFSSPGIWQVPVPSGTPQKVPGLENVNARRWWTVGPDSIWFYDESQGEPGLYHYAFATKRISRLTTVDRNIPVSTPSLSLSPDGRFLIFSRIDTASSSLMAIRGSFLAP